MKLVFIRLGMGPDPRVSKVLMEIMSNPEEAKVMPLPGLIISVFESEYMPSDIRERFFKDPELTDVPFLVFEAENFDVNFPIRFRESVFGLGKPEQVNLRRVESCDLTLDDLLDLVSSVGVDNLTSAQRQRLNDLTS
jgi:hypothetical protein